MAPPRYRDRADAGRHLARKLTAYRNRPDVVVLALPRGGVPVAFEVTRALGVPLDVFLVRKLGLPGHEELALGAVASGGARVLNDDIVRAFRIDDATIDAVTAREQRELHRRERLYRRDRPAPDVRGRTVILVDDGLATGASMQAAIAALQRLEPAHIVVAVPIAAPDTCQALRSIVDEVVCASTPEPFDSVGRWYADFTQTTDDEVRELLAHAAVAPARRRTSDAIAEAVREAIEPLAGVSDDYDRLLELIGDAPLVLLGEASHGTHEFYRERAAITRRLIEDKGFMAVAAEADWPDAYRVNRYVHGQSADASAVQALVEFRRFPTWMWRNTDVVAFVEWLRARNDGVSARHRVGFYGLDLYSLQASMKAVLAYLEKVDPDAAGRARARYACFDHFGDDDQVYGFLTGTRAARSCQQEVVDQLVELQRHALDYARRDGRVAEDELFFAEQNARLVKDAEAYYRTMFTGEVSSWNLRDRHMTDTLESLIAHLGRGGRAAKVVVWAHNSHVGDARATEMSRRGELNVGELARERHGKDAVLVGFTTYHGTVTAASDWGAVAERKRVRPALERSWEAVFHAAGRTRFLIDLRRVSSAAAWRTSRLERAIGVVYRPETERQSHYFEAILPEQFDAVLHFDATHAVEPLESGAQWHAPDAPETYPFAI